MMGLRKRQRDTTDRFVDPQRTAPETMRLILNVWRQKNARTPGKMVTYKTASISPDMSFLEMLDVVNEEIIEQGGEPIAFEHDCREGICGSCGMMIGGIAHGPLRETTACQLHMRSFRDGDEITIEPWRSRAFPVIKDLVVDRGAFDRIIQAGGYITAPTGSAPDANAIQIPKPDADFAFEAAACIGCGACVAQCPNASAMLFTAAKVAHLAVLPQGQPERYTRAISMVEQMEAELFGNCTNIGECSVVCPKGIPLDVIGLLNRDYRKARMSQGREIREAQ